MQCIKSIIVIFLVFNYVSLSAQNSINFEKGTWTEIKQKAKKEKKFIFLDCYTSWCKPCKVMEKEVFANDSIAKFYNQNFICVKQDMENNVGSILGKQYEIGLYPTFLFIDANDSIHYRTEGYKSVQEFLIIGKKALKKENDKEAKVSSTKKEQIAITDINEIKNLAKKDFLQAYPYICENIDLLDEDYIQKIISENWYNYPMETSNLIEFYYKRLSIENIFSDKYINFLALNLCNSDSHLLYLLINNPKLLPKKCTKDSVMLIIEKVLRREINLMNFNNDADLVSYRKLNKILLKYPLLVSKLSFNLFMADQKYYKITKEWDNYALLYTTEREKYIKDEYQYNEISWLFYQYVNNQIYLQKSIEWMQKVVLSKPQADYYFTLANLLAKVGKKEEAIKVLTNGINLMKTANEDTSLYEETLAKIKNSK